MKYIEDWYNISIFVMFVILFLIAITGCSTISDTTAPDGTKTHFETSNAFLGKNVNAQGNAYGFKIVTTDPQNPTPTIILGFGQSFYHSVPMMAGQEFYVRHCTGSIFSDTPLETTEIYVGKSTGNEILNVSGGSGFFIPSMSLKIDTARIE